MTAPGAAEIVLANPPSTPDIETVLKETLMDEESLVLVMEEEQTGVKVGRFLKDGKEITWDGLIDSKVPFDKSSSSQTAAEDVVIESEEAKGAVKVDELKQKVVASRESNIKEPVKKNSSSMSKNTDEKKDVPLIKQVQPLPFSSTEPTRVFLGCVESVTKVWVVREDDEERLNDLNAKLSQLKKGRKLKNNLSKMEFLILKILELTPSLKWRPGAVFGCNSSEYEGFYRAAVVEKEGTSKARVQFIDFGNYEVKPLSDLLNIPKDLAKEVSFAVGVTLQNSLEDNEDNRNSIEEKLGQENLTVTVVNGSAEFAAEGKILDFKESTPLEMKPVNVPAQDIPKVSECKIAEKTRYDPKSQLLPETLVLTDKKEEEEEVKPQKNDVEESAMPIKLKEPILENERDVRKAGKIFSDAIANLKSQDHKTSKPSIPSPKAPSSSSTDCPWKKGDAVVVRSVTGVWQKASVLEVRPDRGTEKNTVLVSSPGAPPMWKRTKDIRSSCVPMDALNLIEKDLNCNLVRPQGDGEVAEETKLKPCLPLPNVVGKVRDWMDKNIDITPAASKVSPTMSDSNKSIPQGPKLVTYIQNSAGSNHVQAVLSTSNLSLARYDRHF